MTESLNPKRDAILEQYPDLTLLSADGFDGAIIGVDIGPPARLKYSVSAMIDILVAEYAGEPEDPDYDHYTMAREHLDFNVIGAYVGPQTPIYVEDDITEEDDGEA